jgi:hypothetical protein
MFYRLIQRAVPGWFPYNSLHVMQPMFTKDMNRQIAEEIGTIAQYTLEDPSPPRKPVILTKHDLICKVLKDQRHFAVPWSAAFSQLFPGEKDFSTYMLAGDKPANTAQRNLVGDTLYSPTEFKKLLSDFVFSVGTSYLKAESFKVGKSMEQIDIIREYNPRFYMTCHFG